MDTKKILNIKQQIEDLKSKNIPIRKSTAPKLYQDILGATSFLPKKSKIKERIFCISNNITTRKICSNCNINEVSFLGPATGYRAFCSTKCSNSSEETRLKVQNTNIKKFNKNQLPANVEKLKNLHLLSFIQYHYNKKIEFNSRSIIPPNEIDIFLPNIQLGIEYNGMYWHSEIAGRTKQYHTNKWLKCNQQNIRLVQIWENEWVNNPHLVKSRIKNLLGVIDNKIYARKCTIKKLDSKTAKDFFNSNHTQRYVNSQHKFGLYHENLLVAAITFSKSRYDESEYELVRYANLIDHTVIGGASKLFKHFTKTFNPSSITSYCDLRWGSGNMYEKLGFEFIKRTPPNYYYFKTSNPYTLYSRVKFQKYKLNKLLPSYDDSLSEWDNMKNNGYNRIWDCGQLKYIWKP